MGVNVARWLKTGLVCTSDADCGAGTACVPFEPQPFLATECHYSEGFPGKVCAPLPLPFLADNVPVDQYVSQYIRGDGEMYPKGTAPVTASGLPIRATTHVVISTASADMGFGYIQEPSYAYPLAMAVAGGGRWMMPTHTGQILYFPDKFGPYLGDWDDQLQALIDAIRTDATTRECVQADLAGFSVMP